MKPSISSESTTTEQTETECMNGVEEVVEIVGWQTDGSSQACVIYGQNVDVAYFNYIFPEMADKAVRLHGGDVKFHVLKDRLDGVFIPTGDQYVYTGDPWPFETVRPLMTVEHLGTALKPLRLDNNGAILSYEIDREKSMPWFFDEMNFNQSYDIGSFAVSADGRYIVADTSMGTGEYVKIDTQTKQITILAPTHPVGMSPDFPIGRIRVKTVSDDGLYALIGPSTIIMKTDGCGTIFTGKLEMPEAMFNTCDMVDVSAIVSEKIGYQFETWYEHFAEGNSALSFKAFDIPPNRVATKADNVLLYPGQNVDAKPKFEYLAMGDSYTSGEGDIEKKADGTDYYLQGTAEDRGCHLSSRAYPFLLRDMWNVDQSRMRSIACSGAKVLPDMYGNASNYMGQDGRLRDLAADMRATVQQESLKNFQPGNVQQIEFVKKYQPTIVTLTGGGNDVGFPDIIAYCADSYRLLGVIPVDETCAYAYDPQMRADLNRMIDDQYSYSKSLIEKIQEISPTTGIYLIGYPQFVAMGWSCIGNSFLLDERERLMIREEVSRLNNILKMVARDTGVYFVDIENSLEGGQICEGSGYMTGPVKLGPSKIIQGKTQEAYHPNAEGHKKIAEAINQQIKSGMNYEILDIPSEVNGRRVVRQAVMPGYTGVGSTKTITMDGGMFMPDGQVTIEMFSRSVKLATVMAESNGSVHAQVAIPEDIEPGDHLLTLTGLDSNGEPLQVQQFVTIENDLPDEVDESVIATTDLTANRGSMAHTDQSFQSILSEKQETIIFPQQTGSSITTTTNLSKTVPRTEIKKGAQGVGWFISGGIVIIIIGALIYNETREKHKKA